MNDAKRVRELFEQACELPVAERERFLIDQCDGELRHEVDLLLAGLDQPLGFIQRLELSSNLTIPSQLSDSKVIDRYVLIRQLGEGGMGTVWEAEQQHPVRRPVAIKLVKSGMDSAAVIARFEAERQTLSMMDHPGISRVYDAGTTEDGRPWFVMELVNGIPITEWCDRHRLPAERRLELFGQVCDAVHHAHQKGIIHRDLKPCNILTAECDGKPVVKIIDFGIAKAIGQDINLESGVTQSGQIIGTLEYMSPEQAGCHRNDIDTRSDIYSLGVLLFELLTGSTPFDRAQLRGAPLDEMLRVIREVEPQRPSEKLSSIETLSDVAINRDTQPMTLSRKVRGELDWIAMRALEKNRERRYGSAAELSADIGRYLRHDPVLASPPSQWYRVRKFIRKNRTVAVAASIGLFLLVAGVIGTSIGMVQARAALTRERSALGEKSAALQAEQHARKETELANHKTLQAIDSLTSSFTKRWLTKQDELSVDDRKFLQDILAYYEDAAHTSSSSGQSQHIQAAGLHKVAELHRTLGDSEQALGNYQQAAQLYHALATSTHRSEYIDGEARCLRSIARVVDNQGNSEAAERFHRQALELLTQLVQTDSDTPVSHVELVESLTDFGSMMHHHGKNSEAEETFQRAETAFQAIPKTALDAVERQTLYASMLQNRCYFFRELGRFDQALADGMKAIEIETALIESGLDNAQIRREVSSLQRILGSIYQSRGEFELAEVQFRDALVVAQALVVRYPLVPAHREAVAESHRMLGTNFFHQQEFDKAIEDYKQARIITQRIMEDFPDDPVHLYDHAELCNVMGLAFKDSGKLDDARRELEEAVSLKTKVVEMSGSNFRYLQSLAMSWHNLANVCNRQKDPAVASDCHEKAISIREKLHISNPEVFGTALDLGGSHCDYGKMLVDGHRLDEGRKHLDRAIEILEKLFESNSRNVNARRFLRNARQNRGFAHQLLESWQEALNDFDRALDLDDGSSQARLRQHRVICVCHLDPEKGIDAANDLLQREGAGLSDQFAAARAFAQISGTHPEVITRNQFAERAVQLLRSLNDGGFFRDPVIAATLHKYIEFRYLEKDTEFLSIAGMPKK